MSSRLLTAIALLISVLPAFAKPPELPFDPTVDCADPAAKVPALQERNLDFDVPVAADLFTLKQFQPGNLLFGLGVSSDAALTGGILLGHAVSAAAETPIDGLWLAATVEEKRSCPYADLLLDALIPPLRLRHLTPAKVKELVEEWRPVVVTEWQQLTTLPSGRYLQHNPQYLPPTPDFPLPKELARMEEEAATAAPCVPQGCAQHQPPSCPFGAPRRSLEETEDPAEEEASEEDHDREPPVCEEQEATDADSWEVQVQIKNPRTGEVIVCPKLVIENGKLGEVRIESDRMKINVAVEVGVWTKAEPISTMPHEVEELDVMPQEAETTTEEDKATEPMTEDEDPQPAANHPCHSICPAAGCPRYCPPPVDDPPVVTPAAPETYKPPQPPERYVMPPDDPRFNEQPIKYPKEVLNKEKPSVCPYLKQKAQEVPTVPVEDAIQGTVSDNIDKLIKARKVLKKAEEYQERGELDRAGRLYEKVKALCPGSRLDHEATERIEEIEVLQAAEKVKIGEGEIAEPAAPSEPQDQSNACPWKDCSKFWTKYCKSFFRKSWKQPLVKMMRIVICCDHDCVLLAKAYVCLPVPESAIYPGCHTDEGSTEEAEPEPMEQTQPYDVQLKPELPPIDPKVVDALEKVLKESGAPLKPKLIVVPVEPSDIEEQEEPVSQWPLVPPELEMPSLYLPLETEELDLYEEDGSVAVPTQPDAEAAFRQVLDSLREGMYLDVSGVDPETLETKVTLRLNGIECHLILDGSGHRYFLVGLMPEATGDLKEIQQALNERVMHWINIMNSGGNKVEEEATDTAKDAENDLTDKDEPDEE